MYSQAKKAVKVSYQGETKRLKVSADYNELIERTRTAFKSLPNSYKFFYLDEDNEIISISSQSDFSEALDIEDLASLRLTIASNVSDARSQLLSHLEEQRPLAESLNASQVMSSSQAFSRANSIQKDIFMVGDSDFDAISHQELAQSIIEKRPSITNIAAATASHEMACGSDAPISMRESCSIGTDVMPDKQRFDSGCNTARVMTSEKMIDTTVQMCESSTQVKAKMQDQSCGGKTAEMQHQASQMQVQAHDVDITCNLLVPSDDDAEPMEEMACFKCNGSQVNKKGLPCRKCNGRGTIASRELSDLAGVIRQEVEEYCYTSFKKMFVDYLEDKSEKQENIVHEKVACDGCDVNPIRGIRYMCSVCSDTDFCQKCMRSGVHSNHPLLKVRKPEHAPHKLICQYIPKGRPQELVAIPTLQNFSVDPDNHGWERHSVPAQKQARFSARFVKGSFPDKHEIICNDDFCKSFWMRNDGETAWPAGTQLVQTSGDDIKAKVVTIPKEVPAGDTFEFSVSCKAPEKTGRYSTFFRLQTGRIKFGHKVTCDIMCVDANVMASEDIMEDQAVSEILASPTVVPQPIQMMAQESVLLAAMDKEMGEPDRRLSEFEPLSTAADEHMDAASESQPISALMNSTFSLDAKTPKQLYFEQVEVETDAILREALTNLYESGFTDFKVNKILMHKLKDINAVANQLLTGALSESQFDAIHQ